MIDEIGLMSSKVFESMELICRSIKNNDLIFGGIQVIAAGSFLQLPPVSSVLDPGLFAFQIAKFLQTFPHKLHLNLVV